MTASAEHRPPEDHRPDERRKMTVSERSLGTLGAALDLTEPAVAGRIPFGVIDHLARAWLGGEEGWGLFEHASMGRHDPTGFADWSSVAP